MNDYLSPIQAMEIQLSLNPFRRRQEVSEYIRQLGMANLYLEPTEPLWLGRKTLVDAAWARSDHDAINPIDQEF